MAASKRDYYEVLGVTKGADMEEIKRSYRKMAMKYHPDRNPGDHAAEASFKEAAEAYEVLSDSGKRQRYDQFGHGGVQGQAHDYSGMDAGDIFTMFEDIFGAGFGGGGHRQQQGRQANRPTRGFDLETQVELSLSEVALGAEKTIEFEKQENCGNCKGTGAKPGSQPVQCSTCGGGGRVAQQGFGGMFRMVTTCPSCKGRGQVIKERCNICSGVGRTGQKRVVNVRIPAGVHEGQAVRITGEGEPGDLGGPPGDLHCYIAVKQHEFFSRHNNDIVCQIPISFTQAALGASIEVPTLKNSEEIEIPAGTQHHDIIKLKGKGLPDVRSHRNGDQIVQVVVEIPRKLSERQKQLLQEFASTEEASTGKQKKGFWNKIKGAVGGD